MLADYQRNRVVRKSYSPLRPTAIILNDSVKNIQKTYDINNMCEKLYAHNSPSQLRSYVTSVRVGV